MHGFWISLLVLLASAAGFVEIAFGIRKIGQLKDVEPESGSNPPRVSIVFSALNEADTIEHALRSTLALDYPGIEIIAINDRSTDGTGSILDKLGGQHPAIRVLHIKHLPPGWLGKNHALNEGGKRAGGDYLLFTDADVVFEPSALSRAVAYCERNRLDHLTVFPEMPVSEHLLAMLLLNGYVWMFLRMKPWKMRTSAKYFVGIGAFNLLRADAYRQVGGHSAIRMAVLDDKMLAQIVKQNGQSQDVLFGMGMVSVEWYRSAREMFRGLRKNSFAIVDYKLVKLATSTAFVLPQIWPWVGVFVTQGVVWWLNFTTLALTVVFYNHLVRRFGWSRWCLLYLPIASVISLSMLWSGCVLTLIRGGIDWRGTRYSLADLKRAHATTASAPD